MKKTQIQISIKTKLRNIETIKKAIHKGFKNLKNYRTTYGFYVSKIGIYNHSKTLKEISFNLYIPLFALNLRETFEKQRGREYKAFTEMAIYFDGFIKNLNPLLENTKSKVNINEW